MKKKFKKKFTSFLCVLSACVCLLGGSLTVFAADAFTASDITVNEHMSISDVTDNASYSSIFSNLGSGVALASKRVYSDSTFKVSAVRVTPSVAVDGLRSFSFGLVQTGNNYVNDVGFVFYGLNDSLPSSLSFDVLMAYKSDSSDTISFSNKSVTINKSIVNGYGCYYMVPYDLGFSFVSHYADFESYFFNPTFLIAGVWGQDAVLEGFLGVDGFISSGAYNPDVPSTPDLGDPTLDTNVGYLHDFKKSTLALVSEDDPNHKWDGTGNTPYYSPYDARNDFTWSDSYPDYGDDYYVQIYYQTVASVRGLFGTTDKGTLKGPKILVATVPYKSLKASVVYSEYIATSEYQAFKKQCQEKAGTTGAFYTDEDVFARIVYKSPDGNKYGYWTSLNYVDYGLDNNYKQELSYGVEDSNGNYTNVSEKELITKKDFGYGSTYEEAEANKKEQDYSSEFKLESISDLMEYFKELLNILKDTLGAVPAFVQSVFGFLPQQITYLLLFGIFLCVLLRIIGR